MIQKTILENIQENALPVVALSASVALLGGSVFQGQLNKTLSILGAAGSALGANMIRQEHTINDRKRQHQERLRKANDQYQAIYQAVPNFMPGRRLPPDPPKEVLVEIEKPQYFNFEDFEKHPDKYPHVLIIGETGSGKSTLAEYLAILTGGKKYAIAPHRKPGEWLGFDGVFGGGRNYGCFEVEDIDKKGKKVKYPIDFPEFTKLNTSHTVAQVLLSLNAEMDRRYKLRDQGLPGGDFINFFIDEIPACAKHLGDQYTDILSNLILEARKVGIRLWLLAQGQLVKMLGLEGQSEVRESLTYIKLGTFAKEYASQLWTKKKFRDDWMEEIATADRPCMVEDLPATIPGISYMRSVIENSVKSQETEKIDQKAVVLQLLDQGFNKTNIIKNLWGFTGEKYQNGLSIWKTLGIDESPES